VARLPASLRDAKGEEKRGEGGIVFPAVNCWAIVLASLRDANEKETEEGRRTGEENDG